MILCLFEIKYGIVATVNKTPVPNTVALIGDLSLF